MIEEESFYCCSRQVQMFDRDHFVCSLFTSEKARSIYLVFHAFNIEINNILYKTNDIMISLICLKWWKERIEQIYENDVQLVHSHYILKEIKKIIDLTAIPMTLFLRYFDGCEKIVLKTFFNSLQDLEETAEGTTVSLMKIIFIASGIYQESLGNLIYHAGVAWSLMNNLRNEGKYHLKNKTLLPKDLLDESGISILNICDSKNKKLLREVIGFIVKRIESHIDQARNLLVKMLVGHNELISIAMEMTLADLYIKSINKRNFDIIQKNKELLLSPIIQLKLLFYYIRFCLHRAILSFMRKI